MMLETWGSNVENSLPSLLGGVGGVQLHPDIDDRLSPRGIRATQV